MIKSQYILTNIVRCQMKRNFSLVLKKIHLLQNTKFENPMYNNGYDDGFADGANSIEE